MNHLTMISPGLSWQEQAGQACAVHGNRTIKGEKCIGAARLYFVSMAARTSHPPALSLSLLGTGLGNWRAMLLCCLPTWG